MTYWHTLGWLLVRSSRLEEARNYLQASWNLGQDSPVGNHLCEVYERLHQVEAAIQMCRMAEFRVPLSTGWSLDEVKAGSEDLQQRLKRLTAGAARPKRDGSDFVIDERTFKLPRFMPGSESAEFFVLFSSEGSSKTFKVEDVQFVRGSDKMKTADKQIRSINFGFVAPGPEPTRFVRRGLLACYQYGGCSLVLFAPEAVLSVN